MQDFRGGEKLDDFNVVLDSSSFYPATFGAGGNRGIEDGTGANKRYPEWAQVEGAGTIVYVCEDGTTVTRPCSGGEIIRGVIKRVTSMGATRLILGVGDPPPATPGGVNVQAVNLAGGSSSVTGVLPAGNHQRWFQGGTAASSAFTASIMTMHKINPSGATFAINFPAISSANDGQSIAIVNVSTGSTATVLSPAGSNNIGQTAGSATGATAAGPTGGAVAVYTADNSLGTGAWIKSI